jgi:hypothetical protein
MLLRDGKAIQRREALSCLIVHNLIFHSVPI